MILIIIMSIAIIGRMTVFMRCTYCMISIANSAQGTAVGQDQKLTDYVSDVILEFFGEGGALQAGHWGGGSAFGEDAGLFAFVNGS